MFISKPIEIRYLPWSHIEHTDQYLQYLHVWQAERSELK